MRQREEGHAGTAEYVFVMVRKSYNYFINDKCLFCFFSNALRFSYTAPSPWADLQSSHSITKP